MTPGSWVAASCALLVVAVGCDQGQGTSINHAAGAGSGGNATGSPPEQPWWVLPAGSRYFEREGRRSPLLMRNATAPTVPAFGELLRQAHSAGAKLIRIQLTQGFGYETLGIDSQGSVLQGWAASWDAVLEQAKAQELAVVPVFGIWGDWNDGQPALGWTHFDANPLNQSKGGPAASPAELFEDTETQRLWLGWLATLIERWSGHPHIVAWEVFSELDLATGANEANATAFAERAADIIRARDPLARPVLASTSDLPLILGEPWNTLWASRANDLVSIHPYDAELDRVAVERVRALLAATEKPVFIGESGLSAAAPDGSTITTSPPARVGLAQAVWAELVSGSATARGLYWEDGYAAYYPGSGLAFVESMNDLDRHAAAWLEGTDFTELSPAELSATPSVFGAALGSTARVLGWVRRWELMAPEFRADPLAATLSIKLPEGALDGAWTVELAGPQGEPLASVEALASAGALSFQVAVPFSSVAFSAQR